MPLSSDILAAYPNQVFIETGTHHGDGVQCALDAGFPCIYSVELSQFAFGYCTHRFLEQQDKVHLYQGDSRKFLKGILPTVTTRVTFWLDAHFCGSDAGTQDDVPLMDELRWIARHEIYSHTILIDDVRLMGTRELFVRLDEVVGKLKMINYRYKISRIASLEFADDILVATI